MTHPLTKSVEEVEREQQERLENKVPVYETGLQRFVKKWGRFWYENVSVKSLPDENDPRYK